MFLLLSVLCSVEYMFKRLIIALIYAVVIFFFEAVLK